MLGVEGGGLKVEGGIWTISTLSQSPSPPAKTREGNLSSPGWWYLFVLVCISID